MSVTARKYRLFCHTFRNYPGIISIFSSRELSSGNGDGSGPYSLSHLHLPTDTNSSKRKGGQEHGVSNPDSLITPNGPASANSTQTHGSSNFGASSYSTSNPIIPDSTFPLPGNIGLSEEFFHTFLQTPRTDTAPLTSSKCEVIATSEGYSKDDITNDIFAHSDFKLPVDESRILTLSKLIKVLRAKASFGETASPTFPDFETLKNLLLSYTGPIEVCTFKCPDFVKKQILPLFPQNADLKNRALVLINLSHQTKNDMSGWNDEVEQERENLIENFIQGAQLICEFLKRQNWFADFIDPLTGKPFYSPHTNFTLFETDELYEKFGFRIDDLGCCKVVHHGAFGTHVFVGTIVTDAPLSEEFLLTSNASE